jgi:hypothetical protein
LPLQNNAKKEKKGAYTRLNTNKREDKMWITLSAQQQISTKEVTNLQQIDS